MQIVETNAARTIHDASQSVRSCIHHRGRLGVCFAAHANAKRQTKQFDRLVTNLRVVIANREHDILEESGRVEEETRRVGKREFTNKQNTLVAFGIRA